MKNFLGTIFVTLLLYGGANLANAEVARREVNITLNSELDWLPSETQEKQASQVASEFYTMLDNGNYRAAYDLMTDVTRQLMPFSAIEDRRSFYDKAGTLIERRFSKVTWTKYPNEVPYRGVFVAIDVSSRFKNVDRQCGYIVLHQKTVAEPFKVERFENNFIDNDTAKQIEKDHSKVYLEQVWSQMSAYCPNYRPN